MAKIILTPPSRLEPPTSCGEVTWHRQLTFRTPPSLGELRTWRDGAGAYPPEAVIHDLTRPEDTAALSFLEYRNGHGPVLRELLPTCRFWNGPQFKETLTTEQFVNKYFVAQMGRRYSRDRHTEFAVEINEEIRDTTFNPRLEDYVNIDNCCALVYHESGKLLIALYNDIMFVTLAKAYKETIEQWIQYSLYFKSVLDTVLLNNITPKGVRCQEQIPDDLTVGLDPELEAFYCDSDGEPDLDDYCHANNIVNSDTGANVGTDGNCSIFEFRPEHSANVTEVVDNIQCCFDVLGNAFKKKGFDKAYVMAGGGLIQSIGGHVHLGGRIFKRLRQEEVYRFFCRMMDDFLYIPMRTRMPGAIREWSNLSHISRQSMFGDRSLLYKSKKSLDEAMKNRQRFGRNANYSAYDEASQARFPPWGIEYRSLPSFIADKDLSHAVLEMSLLLARKMLWCYNKQESFEYNAPPKTADYLKVFPRELVTKFMRYINGDRRDVFLTNVLENWDSMPGRFFTIITTNLVGVKNASISSSITRSLSDVFREYHGKSGSKSRMNGISLIERPMPRDIGYVTKLRNTLVFQRFRAIEGSAPPSMTKRSGEEFMYISFGNSRSIPPEEKVAIRLDAIKHTLLARLYEFFLDKDKPDLTTAIRSEIKEKFLRAWPFSNKEIRDEGIIPLEYRAPETPNPRARGEEPGVPRTGGARPYLEIELGEDVDDAHLTREGWEYDSECDCNRCQEYRDDTLEEEDEDEEVENDDGTFTRPDGTLCDCERCQRARENRLSNAQGIGGHEWTTNPVPPVRLDDAE